MPDFEYEHGFNGAVIGFDEVGRAPLAGPVVAACVYIPDNAYGADIWTRVNDSKKISKTKRIAMVGEIKAHSICAIGECSPREIEELNISQASFEAMRRAFAKISNDIPTQARLALVDGNITPKEFPCPVQTLIKGDGKSVSIASASILAKVYRDTLMGKMGQDCLHYGWANNSGYPTRQHLDAINLHGITDYHRRSFAPVYNYIEHGNTHPESKIAV